MAADNNWGFILQQAKPSRCLSEDESRPALKWARLRHEGERTYLYATDSYVLLRLPVRFDGTAEERNALLPECNLPRETVEALDDASGFRIVDGYLELNSRAARFPTGPTEKPDLKRLLDEALAKLEAGETKAFNRFGLDPRLLLRLTEGLGAHRQVVLELIRPHYSMVVTPYPGRRQDDELGLIMPVRLEVGE